MVELCTVMVKEECCDVLTTTCTSAFLVKYSGVCYLVLSVLTFVGRCDFKMVDLPSREALRNARRVCVKAGTGVVANEDGSASLTRVGSLAEQIAELCQAGVEVILVSSGSVGMGKRLLRRQANVNLTFKELQEGGTREGNEEMHRTASFTSLLDIKQRPHTFRQKKQVYDSACAAAGQFEMMSLYNALFSQCDLVASQILVTQADFSDEKRIQNLKYAIERLLSLGIVPIINENDAVSANVRATREFAHIPDIFGTGWVHARRYLFRQ